MKTEASDQLQKHICDESKRLRDMASMYALQYAESDDPADKANYTRYRFAADEVQKLHGPVCQTLHLLESVITETEPKP